MPTLALLGRSYQAPQPPTPGPPGLAEARSGVMRSGAGRASYYSPVVSCTIAGVRRERRLHCQDLELTWTLNAEPDTLTGSAHAFEPLVGQEIILGMGAPDHRWFGGHILSVEAQRLTVTGPPIYQFSAIDYTWELGHRRVRARKFVNTPVNYIVAALISDFAQRFTLYGRPFGLASTDFQSNDDEDLPAAITRVMKMVDGDWYVDPYRRIHLVMADEAADIVMTNATRAMQLAYADDMSQIRSRTVVQGGSSTTTALVLTSADSLPIADTRLFGENGGYALVGASCISYTAKSVPEGPGTLTGIPVSDDLSIRYDIAQGETVRVYAIADDLGAQTTIAARLGSGHTGVIEYAIKDGNFGDHAARIAAQADLNQFAQETERRLSFATREKAYNLGRHIVGSVTDPRAISGMYQIHRLVFTKFPIPVATSAGNLFPVRQVEAGINRSRDARELIQVLA